MTELLSVPTQHYSDNVYPYTRGSDPLYKKGFPHWLQHRKETWNGKGEYLYTHSHILYATRFNPLLTIGNSLKKQKSMYKVLTPSIKPPI